ncbi:MAG: LLM class flavin-dependent oxidoreductase [Gammaproteobacteria bacterium]|nr:LLM class flavin-dependent oxidoreductase [Gammaproteobacteria bacterium]
MKIYTTAPLEDPRDARLIYKKLEDIGYDGGLSLKPSTIHSHAGGCLGHTGTRAIGYGDSDFLARNPMNLANLGYDMQSISGGRFVLGLGTQVRPHIEKRFSSTWSKPAARMREIVQAIRAIWDHWEGKANWLLQRGVLHPLHHDSRL